MVAITGLIPCAGSASRLDGLPKFLLPAADGFLLGHLIDRMRGAGADNVWIGASKQNAAFIKPYVTTGSLKGTLETNTMVETIMAAREYCADDTVLFGMPDTYWDTPDVYELLAQRITAFGADVAVGLWPIRPDQRGNLGVCDVHNDRIVDVVDKDALCPYNLAWGALAWNARFWSFMDSAQRHPGETLLAAIRGGLRVVGVQLMGSYYDCGTRAEYFQLCSTFIQEYAR